MLKNDKEWEWKINRVMLFGLTALVFTSCFALSGTAFLSFLLVSSYYLLLLIPVELCKYSRTSWRHYKMSMLVAWTCVSFSFAWAETVLVQSLQESAQWVFELKKKKKKPVGKQSADPSTVLLDLHGNESSKHLHIISLLPLPTVHAKHSSDPDKKKMSLFSGSHKHGQTLSLYMYWKYKS